LVYVWGDSGGFGTEIHLSKALGVTIDWNSLGWRNRNDYKNNGYDDNAIKLAALYQWVWNIDELVSTGMLV
jgi:hypothetical protein